jgi:oligopeptide transport system permease protein
MAEKNFNHIPKDKFTFVNEGERLTDQKFDDKPVSYFKDAWIRFKKSKASVAATVIIVCIILYAFLAPVLITSHESTFMVNMYAKKPARVASLRQYGIFDGGVNRDFSEKGLIKAVGIGIGAENWDGTPVTLEEGLQSEYQPMLEIGEPKTVVGPGKKESKSFSGRIDSYLEFGFFYRSIKQDELQNILDWEAETGKKVLYPLVENNKWCMDAQDANYWYKSNKGTPVVLDENGKAKTIEYGEGMMLEDNYKRDENGQPIYWEYTGGGTFETAQLKVRVLYYNYYQYLYGSTPDYIMGTDSQGYDLALRIAGGIKLSLLVAVFVCVINFVLGSIYGAIEGYYGGTIDIVMERISDILWNVPFIVVATLFQIHLSTKLGAIPCLLFAYVVTGWISTASRVRTQFYRFKTQEYVMAARTLGARDSRIIWKHIFPNSLGTIITSSALAIPSTMLSESMLSFLGIVKLGTAESTSLGTLLADASGIWTNYPHLMIYPAIVISLLMICFNLFGNGLRDAFNPALRGVEE